ncbi:hypothetical protein Q73_16135 [Bacillus coahuilensis m2-6]|uniref:Peptide ABC transporter permease n=1 Tax=Bacillus coahuilensis p1.1.43 TaxID=1150625 RepID=A0A147K4W6_9BACI|nr:anti-sigma-F factor Fin family protein [Bacillus coahuilensis]KUP04217.1 hypothetical protein Q73_16135 [Bacillus coahuilensis m2-6]KUP04557.1 hypothetical protein Q75_15120 [Bacillus coahuilensis p1.1.43]
MAIHYTCRHCGTHIGSIQNMSIHSEKLGLQALNQEERNEMVSYTDDGNIMIQAICEDCQESLERTPDYHLLDFLIH